MPLIDDSDSKDSAALGGIDSLTSCQKGYIQNDQHLTSYMQNCYAEIGKTVVVEAGVVLELHMKMERKNWRYYLKSLEVVVVVDLIFDFLGVVIYLKMYLLEQVE